MRETEAETERKREGEGLTPEMRQNVGRESFTDAFRRRDGRAATTTVDYDL